MHAGSQTDVLIMDCKAYDKVSRLAMKLRKYYGIRGKTNQWIQSFLSDRSQKVVVKGMNSNDVVDVS